MRHDERRGPLLLIGINRTAKYNGSTSGATLRMAERAGLSNAMLHLLTGDEFGSTRGRAFLRGETPGAFPGQLGNRCCDRRLGQEAPAIPARQSDSHRGEQRGCDDGRHENRQGVSQY
jgi:hypothetical protein